MKKAVSRYRTAIEWALSATALMTVMLVMLAVDTPVSQYAGSMAHSLAPAGGGIGVPKPIAEAARTAWQICMDHQQLASFAGVAVVLVFFMRRMR